MTNRDPNDELPELAELKTAYQNVQAPTYLAGRIMARAQTPAKSHNYWLRWPLHAVAATIMIAALLLPIWNSWQVGDGHAPSLSTLSLSSLPQLPTSPALSLPGLSNLSGLSALPAQPQSPSRLKRTRKPQALAPVHQYACLCFIHTPNQS